MGKLYEELTPTLIDFIVQQQLFFVGTAPLSEQGHVNISPKGMDSLRVLDSKTVAYLGPYRSGSSVAVWVSINRNATRSEPRLLNQWL